MPRRAGAWTRYVGQSSGSCNDDDPVAESRLIVTTTLTYASLMSPAHAIHSATKARLASVRNVQEVYLSWMAIAQKDVGALMQVNWPDLLLR